MRRAPFPAGRARIRPAFRNKDSIKMNRKKLVGCHSVRFLPIPQFSIHLRIVLPASQAFPLFRSAVSGRSHDAPSPEVCMSGGSDVCRAGFPGLHTLPTHPLIGFLHAAQSGCLHNQVVCITGVFLPGDILAALCGSVRLCAALDGSWRPRPDATLRMSAMPLPDMLRLRFLDPLRVRFLDPVRFFGCTA